MKIFPLWALLALPALLAACAQPQPRPDVVRDRIGDELTEAMANRKTQSVADTAAKGLLMPLTVEMPKQENGDTRFDLSVVNAPAAQVFMALVTGTRYNMLVGPEVNGAITINLKDVTVKDALESIRELYGYEFTIKGNRISIQPNTLQTRVFQVNYLASRRQGFTELRVNSNSIAGSGTSTPGTGTTPIPAGTGGNAATGGNTTSRVQSDSDTNFWKDLKDALDIIVPKPGTTVVNHISGVVLVHGLPGQLRAVEQYLRATQLMVERQVMLEAKILDVQLSEKFQNGINWASFNSSNNRVSIGTSASGTLLQPTGGNVLNNSTLGAIGSREVFGTPGVGGSILATALGGGFAGLAVQTANFAALLSFLETQGTVSVLSSPRIATINNQKAVLKVGTDELFVTNVTTTQTSTVSGTTSTPSITLQPYFSGISLDVTPQIDDEGNIILHVHPAISKVEEKEKNIDLGDMGTYKLPLASSSVNETDSIVRVQDGTIVAIGGLMTHGQTTDRNGLAGTLSSPAGALVGQRGSLMTKRELVVLLKPTVIRDDSSWLKDLEQSSERMRNMNMPQSPFSLQ